MDGGPSKCGSFGALVDIDIVSFWAAPPDGSSFGVAGTPEVVDVRASAVGIVPPDEGPSRRALFRTLPPGAAA